MKGQVVIYLCPGRCLGQATIKGQILIRCTEAAWGGEGQPLLVSMASVAAKSHAKTCGVGCHLASQWYPRSTYHGGHASRSIGRHGEFLLNIKAWPTA